MLLDTSDLKINVFKVLHVELMKSEILKEDVYADKVSLISMEFVLNVLKELFGALPHKNVSTFVDKTQLSLNQLENVNALKVMD